MKRRQLTADERWKVYIKDNGICQICGKPLAYEEMTVDHIIPLAHGGVNQISNFQYACRSCNQFKQNFPPQDFYEMITEIYWYQTKMWDRLYGKIERVTAVKVVATLKQEKNL